jgi:hypothetical protein
MPLTNISRLDLDTAIFVIDLEDAVKKPNFKKNAFLLIIF